MGRRKGDGSVAKVLALQWGSPEFDAQDLCEKMLSTVMCAYGTWREGQTDSCGLLARKPYLLSESSARERLSAYKGGTSKMA